MLKMIVDQAKNRGMMINNYAGPMSSNGFNSSNPYYGGFAASENQDKIYKNQSKSGLMMSKSFYN